MGKKSPESLDVVCWIESQQTARRDDGTKVGDSNNQHLTMWCLIGFCCLLGTGLFGFVLICFGWSIRLEEIPCKCQDKNRTELAF